MIDRIQIFSVMGSVGLLVFIFYLIKTKQLRIQYALLWLLTAIMLLILSMHRGLLDLIAKWLGIFYPPAVLFIIELSFFLLILLHFSLIISHLSDCNKELAQRLSILTWRLEVLEKNNQQKFSRKTL